jgi:hypothetical protein
MGTYEDVFRATTDDPQSFWLNAAEDIDWYVAPQRALDSSGAPFYRWFPDGPLNVCFNGRDRHVEAGRGEQPALIYDSPVTDTRRTFPCGREGLFGASRGTARPVARAVPRQVLGQTRRRVKRWLGLPV